LASSGRCGCTAAAANRVASRTSFHAAFFTGALNRNSPTGASANGTPRNTRTPSAPSPFSNPHGVVTSPASAAAACAQTPRPRNPSAAADAPTTNSLRETLIFSIPPF